MNQVVVSNKYSDLIVVGNGIVVSNYITGMEHHWLYHVEFRAYDKNNKKRVWSLSKNQRVYKSLWESQHGSSYKNKNALDDNIINQFLDDIIQKYSGSVDMIIDIISNMKPRTIYGYGALLDVMFSNYDKAHIIMTEGLVDAFVIDRIITGVFNRHNIITIGCSASNFKSFARYLLYINNKYFKKRINILLFGDNDASGSMAIRQLNQVVYKRDIQNRINVLDLRFLYKSHKDIIDALLLLSKNDRDTDDDNGFSWMYKLIDIIYDIVIDTKNIHYEQA